MVTTTCKYVNMMTTGNFDLLKVVLNWNICLSITSVNLICPISGSDPGEGLLEGHISSTEAQLGGTNGIYILSFFSLKFIAFISYVSCFMTMRVISVSSRYCSIFWRTSYINAIAFIWTRWMNTSHTHLHASAHYD